MSEIATRGVSLLARFAEFYEEVARLKLAIRDGRLALYLGAGGEPAAASGNDLAAMASERLKQRLQQQHRAMRDAGTEAEIEAYRVAQYVMAALADEIFLLEVEWPGRDAWQHFLLERSLFRSSNAGRYVFLYLDRLLKSRVQSPLQDDLAAVFLIALQLGFRGEHRGARGAPVLANYRAKLIQFLGAAHAAAPEQPGFPQAYQYCLSESRGQRLAPVARWYRFAAAGLIGYLLLSSAVWAALMSRFSEVLSAG